MKTLVKRIAFIVMTTCLFLAFLMMLVAVAWAIYEANNIKETLVFSILFLFALSSFIFFTLTTFNDFDWRWID